MALMSLGQLYQHVRHTLRTAQVKNADYQARLLVCAFCKIELYKLIASPEQQVEETISASVHEAAQQVIAGKSIHRILGYRSFFGNDLHLNADTLEPRPDTETLIEVVQDLYAPQVQFKALDIGTGSGAIAITLASLFKNATLYASDISKNALHMAQKNAAQIGVVDRMRFIESDGFAAIEGKFDLIISNPPYIRSQDIESLDAIVKNQDPRRALDGGTDGLDFYRLISQQAHHYLENNGHIIVEIGYDQAEDVQDLFAHAHYQCVEQRKDLGGIVRALHFKLSDKDA